MKIPLVYLVLATDFLFAAPVYWHARRTGRRSPAFDALIVTMIPILGLIMYVSSVRLGLTPPPVNPPSIEPERRQSPGSGSLVAELTAEIRRLRADLDDALAELARIRSRDDGE